ncbi:hypothetical protein [Rhodococcus sp. NPDC059234]|uniref:hypothetical protein n=1 Tax=Rhodococcus sp. NPDC059234 TaxID=3346781 RepID=UPI00366FAEC0
MAPWILAWETSDDPDDAVLDWWNDGLEALATQIDSSVIWCPRTSTVTAPAEYTDEDVTAFLWLCTAEYAGING